MLCISRGFDGRRAFGARAKDIRWRRTGSGNGLRAARPSRAAGGFGSFETTLHRRRGFAAPTRTTSEGANPLAVADGHAREARLPGFLARSAQHFERNAQR